MKIQFDDEKIKSTLKKTSFDWAGNIYLVNDSRSAYDFDEISKQIAAQVRLGKKARSCDALIIDKEYNYLIEFKNMKSGDLNRCKSELHEKAYDSMFQLQLYLGGEERLDELANRTRLIVVYNDSKGAEDRKTDVASSGSIDKIIGKLKNFSNIQGEWDSLPKKFRLGVFEGKFYNKVYTIDVKKFETMKKYLFEEA